MKLIMSFMLIGFLALSCKKETRTEQSTITTDTIIADTMRADTTNPAVSSPLPSDTLRTKDSISTNKRDTARTTSDANRKK